MPKILFIAAHRTDRSPSQRFRFEQYFTFLEANGWECRLSNLLSEKDDRVFYKKGNFHLKAFIFFKSIIKRWKDVLQRNKYDIIFIQREAFMTGSVFFEKRFCNSRAKVIFDFDDAIWNLDVSDANKKLGFLKKPSKTSRIIAMADLVFAGNQYLAEYARQFNENVMIIPTTIETAEMIPAGKKHLSNGSVCIGWTGSLTTIKHFEHAVPFLTDLKQEFGDKICIKVIGDKNYENRELGIKGSDWNKENEIPELQSFDIGLMPLPDDEWAKGKCGLKGLQCMALGTPVVMSPVGVNTEIVKNGVNGFLASTQEEWVECLRSLVKDSLLRQKLGAEARKTVEIHYSREAWQKVYLDTFNKLIQ